MLQAVIFDVDGTLIDSNDLHAESWQRAFHHFGFDIPYDELRQQVGKGGDNYVPYFLSPQDNERLGKQIDQFKGELFKREYASRIKPFPKVRELFERIRREGLRIALATSSKGDELAEYKKLLNIDDLLEHETSKDDAEHSKPNPDVFAAALEKLEIPACDAIAVGDTPYDAQASTKIGLRIIGVLCGGFAEQGLRRAGCFAVYRDPADLLKNFDESPFSVRKAA